MAKLPHADLVQCIAVTAQSDHGIKRARSVWAAANAKKRVQGTAEPVHRTRSPKKTGCPEGITARRTARPIA